MKHIRWIAVLLAVCFLAALTAGCSSKAVMKVDGKNVPAGFYVYNYCKAYSSASGTGSADDVANNAAQGVLRYYLVEKLCKQYGIELAALERKAVLDSISEQMKVSQGSSTYKTFLQKMQLTKGQYQDLMYNAAKENKLIDYLYNAETGVEKPSYEELYQLFVDNYCSACHVLISTQSAKEQKDYDAALAKAQEVLAKARAGEDFWELIREYGDDPGMASGEDYIFPEGQMVKAFEDAAFALQPGEISDIVQSSYGYHIIRRSEITHEVFDQYYDQFYESAKSYFFHQKLTKEAETMDAQVLEGMASLNLNDALAFTMGY